MFFFSNTVYAQKEGKIAFNFSLFNFEYKVQCNWLPLLCYCSRRIELIFRFAWIILLLKKSFIIIRIKNLEIQNLSKNLSDFVVCAMKKKKLKKIGLPKLKVSPWSALMSKSQGKYDYSLIKDQN